MSTGRPVTMPIVMYVDVCVSALVVRGRSVLGIVVSGGVGLLGAMYVLLDDIRLVRRLLYFTSLHREIQSLHQDWSQERSRLLHAAPKPCATLPLRLVAQTQPLILKVALEGCKMKELAETQCGHQHTRSIAAVGVVTHAVLYQSQVVHGLTLKMSPACSEGLCSSVLQDLVAEVHLPRD